MATKCFFAAPCVNSKTRTKPTCRVLNKGPFCIIRSLVASRRVYYNDESPLHENESSEARHDWLCIDRRVLKTYLPDALSRKFRNFPTETYLDNVLSTDTANMTRNAEGKERLEPIPSRPKAHDRYTIRIKNEGNSSMPQASRGLHSRPYGRIGSVTIRRSPRHRSNR